MTFTHYDPDPLTVADINLAADVYDRGYDVGFAEAAERRSLDFRPFAYGLAAGAAVALIIALAVLR